MIDKITDAVITALKIVEVLLLMVLVIGIGVLIGEVVK